MLRKISIWVTTLIGLSLAAQLPAQGPAPQSPPAQVSPVAQVPPSTAEAGTPAVPLDSKDLEAWLDGLIPYALDQGKVAGAVVVVVRGSGPVLAKGYGYADMAARKPVTADATLFRPGSVSKLITWTAVMQQVEEGKLDLDRDVNAYLDFKIPQFEGKPITLRNIMTHTAGFEESVRHLITSDPKGVQPLKALMPAALPKRVFAPGTTPAYSNYATALAGYIVERVSGMPFDDYVERRIFQPLGMNRSTFRQPLPAALAPIMSNGYMTSGGKPKPFEIVVPFPAGSLSATGADMGKFMMAHLNNGGVLLRPETARLMHDYQAPGIGPLNRMALGFYEMRVNGHRAIAHGGDTTLFHSDLWLIPDADVGIFISMNSDGAPGATLQLRGALFEKFVERYLPGKDSDGRVDDATARKHARMLAGHYISSRGSFTNFISLLGLFGQASVSVGEDGRIQFPAMDALSAAPRDWVEIAPFVWRDRNSGEKLAAEVRDGKVVRLSVDTVAPFTVYLRAPLAYNTAWLIPALLIALALTALAALGWPVRALVRRRFAARHPFEGRALMAFRLSRGFAWAVLAAVAGWMALISAFEADIGALGGPTDWLIALLRILTPIAAVGLAVTAGWLTLLAWHARLRWTTRIAALLLLLAGLVLCWVTFGYRLYGFGMVY
jgi:CubicO group peptidase (beta-lactamase class C family)